MTDAQNKPAHPAPGSEAALAPAGSTSLIILNALMSSRAIVEQEIRAERNVETLNLRGVLAGINAAIDAAHARPLWCVNVTGPDDVIAVPSYSAAIDLCDKLNEQFERIRASQKHNSNWPTVRAYPLPWPWYASHHAQALRDGNAEYGVDPLPLPPSKGGE